MLADAVDAVSATTVPVDEFGVCVLSVSCLCLFRVYVSGRAFNQAVRVRGSGFFSSDGHMDGLLFVMCG